MTVTPGPWKPRPVPDLDAAWCDICGTALDINDQCEVCDFDGGSDCA